MSRTAPTTARSLFAGAAAFVLAATAGCGGGGSNGGSNAELVRLLTTSINPGTSGAFFSQQFDAEIPHPPGLYALKSGALPPGLTLHGDTGVIDGYPRQTGTYQFTVSARDGVDTSIPAGRDASFPSDAKTYTMNVALGPPNFLPQQPPAAQYRGSYSFQLDVAGGTKPYTFAQTGGSLPTGLGVDSSGVLKSFPTQAVQHPYSFQVTVTDALGLTDVGNFTVDVVVLPLIIGSSSTLQPAAQGFPYDISLDLASAGAGQPITWSQKTPIAGETLLANIGLEVTNVAGTGHLSVAAPNVGPTTVGTFLFTLHVTDEAGQFADRQFSLKVSAGPVITKVTPNKAVLGAPVVITGLNFQAGAVVILKPGSGQTTTSPSQTTSTQLTLNSVPAQPATGFVTVRVKNPDGGFFDLLNGYAFPATNLTFSTTPILPSSNSPLSSTGIDVGDVNGDGFADIVHCGSNSTWANASGNASGVDLLINAPPGGVFSAATPTFTRIQLATTGDWYAVKLADVNTDGKLDVIALGTVSGLAQARVWLNPSPSSFTSGGFTQTTLISQSGTYSQHVASMAIGLITNDLAPDLAYTQPDYQQIQSATGYTTTKTYGWQQVSGFNTTAGRVSTMKGNGGSFSNLAVASPISGGPVAQGVAITKINNDVRGDVVTSDLNSGWLVSAGYKKNAPYQEHLFLSETTSSDLFGSWTALSGGSQYGISECLSVVSGDVTGDGVEDLLVTRGRQYNSVPQGISQFTKTAASTYAHTYIAGAGAYRYLTIIDADFDEILDVVVTVGPSRIEFYKGRATNGLLLKQNTTINTNSPKFGKLAAGDIDKDGRPDVVVTMSFLADYYADVQATGLTPSPDRGLGGVQGVMILLNTSN